MHKPIFIVVKATNAKNARENAEHFVENKLIGDSEFDWAQGIKESERWPQYIKFDKPRKLDTAVIKELTVLIKQTEKLARERIKIANKTLKKNFREAITRFDMASDLTTFSLIDTTDYSHGEAIVDIDTLNKILNYQRPLWVIGFDAHY